MAKRQNRNRYVGNTRPDALPPQRKRKGSGTTYKVPAKAKQKKLDLQYMEFQAEPKLNEEAKKLRIPNRCDTVIGGKKVSLTKTTTKQNPNYDYKLLVIVGGERCEHDATATFRVDGKSVRRCSIHSLEEAWIDTGEVKERETK